MGENLLSCYLFYVAYCGLIYHDEATRDVASEGVADGVDKVASEVIGV